MVTKDVTAFPRVPIFPPWIRRASNSKDSSRCATNNAPHDIRNSLHEQVKPNRSQMEPNRALTYHQWWKRFEGSDPHAQGVKCSCAILIIASCRSTRTVSWPRWFLISVATLIIRKKMRYPHWVRSIQLPGASNSQFRPKSQHQKMKLVKKQRVNKTRTSISRGSPKYW